MEVHRAAAIDIGSNTTLYLLGDLQINGKIYIADEDTISNDIGRDVFQNGIISPETLRKNTRIIGDLITKAESDGAEKIIIAGTSALRQAANKNDFIDRIRDEFNLELKVIEGSDEAMLSYTGYLTSENSIGEDLVLFDIGGGSTEKIAVRNNYVVESKSVDIGAVRLHKKFPLGDPPDKKTYEQMKKYAEETITSRNISAKNQDKHLIFSGGTATCLAALNLGIDEYRPDAVEGKQLKREWIEDTLAEFTNVNLDQRKKILHFDPDRAEVIIGGTLLMTEIMQLTTTDCCVVTHRGLRFGLLASAFK